MKLCVMVVLLVALAVPASAALVWDEAVNGDLSTNPAAPTPLAFAINGNTVIGTLSSASAVDRDYITFTVPVGEMLTGITLLAFSPNNIAFSSLNVGPTSLVPSAATDPFFMSGIHITAADIGFNLMTFFDTRNVTSNSLPGPQLGAGTYCFLIQQTNPITQPYSLNFILTAPVATDNTTWGAVKALYR